VSLIAVQAETAQYRISGFEHAAAEFAAVSEVAREALAECGGCFGVVCARTSPLSSSRRLAGDVPA